MFFKTVILPFQSISVDELDRLLVDELSRSCFNGTWGLNVSSPFLSQRVLAGGACLLAPPP